MYNLYKKELYEYNSLLSDVRRNDQINHSIEENKKEQNNIIDSILSKYNFLFSYKKYSIYILIF